MRHKTFFRLLLKAVGVLLLAEGVSYLIPVILDVITYVNESTVVTFRTVRPLIYPMAKTIFGAYLFLDGRWLVDKAIPGNRPYCPECGYDLTGVTERCPECSTPFQPGSLTISLPDEEHAKES